MKELCYLVICFCCFSCKHQVQNKDKAITIVLKFYPAGVVQDTRYSLYIVNDSLKVINYSPGNADDISKYQGKLAREQSEKINTLVENIRTPVKYEQLPIEDSWGAILEINDTIYFKNDDFSFETPPKEITALIQYLIKISPVKIELYGFS